MPLRRALADLIDGLATFVAGLLLSNNLGHLLSARAELALHVGEPGNFWRGSIPFVLGYLGVLVHALPFAFFLVRLPEAFAGAGPGKLATGLRIEPAHRGRRFLIKSAGCGLHLLGLVLAWWPLLAAGLLWNVALLLGGTPLLLGRPSLLDRASGALIGSAGS